MKKYVYAAALLTTAPFTFAETVIFSSANCHVKSDHAEVVYASGIVENRTGNYDQLYCNISVKKGKDIIEVGVNMYLLRKKSIHGARCIITFYQEEETQS
ncbi:hypothetical protein PSECIP111951_04102 [Pseudoalteromonas holothuriae]|uniref:Uncharacterized protein n=1 Tax=Pseudoalteromonas holothuriae TaxID=2963714 RepID=A0ABN8UWG5_9GAMM|nr:hypothetical protein [Pseudoalteromonas sp. CIP111951]CAH9068302.1 hypothetical protein PSECIP111951_04102 [Pseudoalteromonas sp. CIP111951]